MQRLLDDGANVGFGLATLGAIEREPERCELEARERRAAREVERGDAVAKEPPAVVELDFARDLGAGEELAQDPSKPPGPCDPARRSPTRKSGPARVELPDFESEGSGKARAVLTDEEIRTLVAHPDVDVEIKMLVLISRTVGGMRAGDLNALDWTAFDRSFSTCTFVRRKTRRKKPGPTTLDIPYPSGSGSRLGGMPTAGPSPGLLSRCDAASVRAKRSGDRT